VQVLEWVEAGSARGGGDRPGPLGERCSRDRAGAVVVLAPYDRAPDGALRAVVVKVRLRKACVAHKAVPLL
jgi:hypothetical protein